MILRFINIFDILSTLHWTPVVIFVYRTFTDAELIDFLSQDFLLMLLDHFPEIER